MVSVKDKNKKIYKIKIVNFVKTDPVGTAPASSRANDLGGPSKG